MAQLKTKFLEDNAVSAEKVRIASGSTLRGRNAGDTADIDLLSNSGDVADLIAGSTVGGSVILKDSDKGAANGVATLDGSSKLPSSQLPVSTVEYLGAWNASTNSPALADGTGTNGDMYRVSVGGSQDLGSGSITFGAGDAVIYNGSVWEKIPSEDLVQSVNGAQGVVVLDTDDISEGAANFYYTEARFNSSFSGKSTTDLSEGTNLYHTVARARSAAVDDTAYGVSWDGVLDQAPSKNAVYDQMELKANDADVVKKAGSTMDSAANLTFAGGGEVLGLPASPSVDGAAASKKYVDDQIAAVDGSAQGREVFTLAAGDITNQYVDLSAVALADSIILSAEGVAQIPGTDFTEALTGGAGGNTRISFAGDLATGGAAALVAGDVLVVNYES